MSSYIRIRLLNAPSNLEADLTALSFQYGASGLSEALSYIQPDLTYDPSVLPVKSHNLDVFFPSRPSQEYFESLKTLSPQLNWEIFEEQNKDWLAEWKKGFEPFQLVSDYWIVPSWRNSPTDPDHTIQIDPGMAFGTGTHATTKMASYFVHKVCSQFKNEKKTLIDVGTGTGILAMLAKKHGIERVLGIEIDTEARRVARENIALNKLEIEVPDAEVEEISEQFDFVVANIIDGVLIQIRSQLFRLLKPNGHLFLTGILVEREDHFLKNFIEPSPLKIVRRIEQDEWVGYWLQA